MDKPHIDLSFDDSELCYVLEGPNLNALETIMHRASFDARTNGEKEVIYCLLACVAGARAHVDRREENELETPY